jgi:Mn2+/Fe2+ NRAMP family transporter
MRLDAWFSMVVFTVATVAFYLLGAAVLHPQGLDPQGSSMIATLSQMYVKPLGVWTREVFLVGAWAVLFKTLYVATAGNSRLTIDFLGLTGLWVPSGPKGRERAIRLLCVFYPMLALLIYFIFREPKRLVTVGGYAQALMLPLIAGSTLYLRRRDTDPRVGPIFLTDILTWIAFFAISAVAIYSVYDLAQGLGQAMNAWISSAKTG